MQSDLLALEQRVGTALVSVNVSRPRTVQHRGRSVSTGIFKEPVDGPVRVARTNLEGDAQADPRFHGGPEKAVYLYDVGGYRHFGDLLGRSLPPGQFGENWTAEGIPEERVRIGDVVCVGTAVVQVTSPRSPCFKLGIAMGSARFPVLFLQSGRTGFYARVLEEGAAGAGDSIALEQSDPAGVTVLEMTRLLYSERRDAALARRALAMRSLSNGLREAIEERY